MELLPGIEAQGMHRAMRGEASPHKLPAFVLVVPSLAQCLALQTPGGVVHTDKTQFGAILSADICYRKGSI